MTIKAISTNKYIKYIGICSKAKHIFKVRVHHLKK